MRMCHSGRCRGQDEQAPVGVRDPRRVGQGALLEDLVHELVGEVARVLRHLLEDPVGLPHHGRTPLGVLHDLTLEGEVEHRLDPPEQPAMIEIVPVGAIVVV